MEHTTDERAAVRAVLTANGIPTKEMRPHAPAAAADATTDRRTEALPGVPAVDTDGDGMSSRRSGELVSCLPPVDAPHRAAGRAKPRVAERAADANTRVVWDRAGGGDGERGVTEPMDPPTADERYERLAAQINDPGLYAIVTALRAMIASLDAEVGRLTDTINRLEGRVENHERRMVEERR